MTNSSLLRSTLAELGLAGRWADYTPAFRAEEFAPDRWWILDDDTRVGVVVGDAHTLELVNWDPAASRPVDFPELYHAPTAPGDRITLANWVEWNQATTSERQELTLAAGGATLTVHFEEWFADGMHALKTCTFAVDPDYGYVVQVTSEVQSPVSHQVEFANFLPERVVDDQLARWPFILWQHPDGRVVRWNQNNAGANTYGLRDHYGRRQIDPEGWLGYFGEPDRCPVVEFSGANQPLAASTCHCMLDEHLHWVVARHQQPPQDEAGRYLYQVAFTLASLPAAAGEKLAARAEPLDLLLDGYPPELAGLYPWTRETPRADGRPVERWPRRYPVFRQGCLCDFTERLDPTISDRAQCFAVPEDDAEAPVSLVSAGGRRTEPCLRLRVQGEPVAVGPEHGTALHLTEGARYQVTAWLRTDLTEGAARLRVWEWCYTPRNLTREYFSVPVSGRSEWTKVAVEFTPEGLMTHCLSLEIVAEGQGTVWVDEVMMERL